jgi:hypothetical protein
MRHESLPQELLSIAADIGAAATRGAKETTPENPGVVSFMDNRVEKQDVIYSALGERLYDVNEEIERKDHLAQFPVALGALASEASISATTGCWSIIEAWRNDKGYAFVWDPDKYGYKIERTSDFKGVQVHRMAVNMTRRIQGLPDLRKSEQVDHVCRWTGCCNIDHLAVLSHRRNNELRDRAKKFEAALISGQLILGPVGLGWLDERLVSASTEFTNIIITTPMGPHRIILVEKDPLVFHGETEPCDLIDAVRPAAPKKYERPNRPRKQYIHEEQKAMFKAEKYAERKKRANRLYKEWQKTGQF